MPDFVVTLNSYLEHLREVSPNADVPNITELAECIGVSESNLGRIANNKIKSINRKTMANIIAELRRRGFDAKETDVVRYVE